MATTNRWRAIAWALVLVVAVGFGWRAGRHTAATGQIAKSAQATSTASRDEHRAATTPKSLDSRDHRTTASAPLPFLPDDLSSIPPEEFAQLLPALKALAAQGRGDAAYEIYRHVDACVGYRASSDSDIEAQASDARDRQRKMIDRAPKDFRSPPEMQPEFRYAEVRRQALGLREQCAEIGTVTGYQSLDWAIKAVDLDDDTAIRILAFGVPSFGRDRTQAVRYAERLVDLQRALTTKLDQRIARGDLGSLQNYAIALGEGGLLLQDISHAYALMYARSLLPSEPNGMDFNLALNGLAERDRHLDIEAARARGIDIARACCGYVASPPGH
jgi:hypothetical protein